MPFQPGLLSERTLKSFVDALVRQRRQPLTTAKQLPLRTACQEEVAKMLGFDHWHHAIDAVRKNTSAGAKTEKPEFWVYPQAPAKFDAQEARKFLAWCIKQDLYQVSSGLSDKNRLQVAHPSFNGMSRAAMARTLDADERRAFLEAFSDAVGAFEAHGPNAYLTGYSSLRIEDGCRRWKLSMGENNFLFTAKLPTEQHNLRAIQATTRFPATLLTRQSEGLSLMSAPTWLNTQGLQEVMEDYWGHSLHVGDEAFEHYPPEFAVGRTTYLASHNVPKGAFHSGFPEMRTFFNEKKRKSLQGKPGRVFLRRCVDAQALIQGRLASKERQVVLCFCGDTNEYDSRFERVSQTLVYAFERFTRKQWKAEARQLIEQASVVSAYLPLKSEMTSRHEVGGIFETLVLDPTVKSRVQQIIEQANSPKDCLAPLARLTIEHAISFEESLKEANKTLDLDEETFARVERMELEWKDKWGIITRSQPRAMRS